MNRFMQIYCKNKNQITTLDLIVKLKTKLKYFFRNYTSLGRAYLLKENILVKEYIHDKSDIIHNKENINKI